MTELARRISDFVRSHGPISVARYMALALGDPRQGFYQRDDPFGSSGHFITAPEVSQTFGELIGLALAQTWLAAGQPAAVHVVELGPGRGTLMGDLLRAALTLPPFRNALDIHLVETSQTLRNVQRRLLGPTARWHDDLGSVPMGAPHFVVANEFLDALPVRQFLRSTEGWHERLVGLDREGRLAFTLDPRPVPLSTVLPEHSDNLPEGAVVEISPAREALVAAVAERIAGEGGLAILIDYGEKALRGDTLQAVRHHARIDPLMAPGEADITSLVDFAAVARAAERAGIRVHGPVAQGEWLRRLGIEQRLERLLSHATADQAVALTSGVDRLVADEAMGKLFKVLALSHPEWPLPPGFLPEGRC